MSLFDTLVSNTACQFSSLNPGWRGFIHQQAAPKLDPLTVAKALYKLKYALDKKLNTSKYFAFVQLETTSKSVSECPRGNNNSKVLQKMVANIECITQRHYQTCLKEDCFMQIVHYSDQKLFRASWKVKKLVEQRNSQHLLYSLGRMKEASRFFQMVDILQHTISQLIRSNTAQCLVSGIQALKNNKDRDLYHTPLLMSTPLDQMVAKLEIEQYPLNDLSMSVDTIGSALQVADMGCYQATTPRKTQRSAVSDKRKIYLSNKRQHSRCDSYGIKQFVSRPSIPIFCLPKPSKQICVRFQTTICLQHEWTSPVSYAKIMHPDQLVKEVGDLLDNLSVFPWYTLDSGCESSKSSMVTSIHIDNVSHLAVNPRKRTKVQPLTVSDKFHQNHVYHKQSLRPRQSQELPKSQKISCKEQINMTKSTKPSSYGQTYKKLGRKSVQNCNPVPISSKVINFLRNEEKPISIPFKSYNSEVKTGSRNTCLQSKVRGRGSVNISSTTSGGGDHNIQKFSQTQKIRRFSPISTIRNKLLTQLK